LRDEQEMHAQKEAAAAQARELAAARAKEQKEQAAARAREQAAAAEKARQDAACTEIQRVWRGVAARKAHAYLRVALGQAASATKIQAAWRGMQGREKAGYTRADKKARDRQRAAATQIQRVWRGFSARNVLRRRVAAAIRIQAGVRGMCARALFRRLVNDKVTAFYRNREAQVVKIQAWWRGWITREWFKANRVYLEIARARRTVRKTLTLLGPEQELPQDYLTNTLYQVPSQLQAQPTGPTAHRPREKPGAKASQTGRRRPHKRGPTGPKKLNAVQSGYSANSALGYADPPMVYHKPQADYGPQPPALRSTTPPPFLEPLNHPGAAMLPPHPMMPQERLPDPTRVLDPVMRAPTRNTLQPRPLKPADEGKGSALNPRAPADSQESIADTSFDVQDPRSLLVEEIKQRKMRIDQLSNQLAGRIDGKIDDLLAVRAVAADGQLPPLRTNSGGRSGLRTTY
jgi:hypothetical protein